MSERGPHPVKADPPSTPAAISPSAAPETPSPPSSPTAPASLPSSVPPAGAPLGARPAVGPQVFELNADPFDITPPGPDQPPAPVMRTRTRKILLGSLLAVAAAGIVVIGVAGWQIGSQKDATLIAPPEVAGLRLDQSEDGKSTADYLQTALSAGTGLDKAVGGVYVGADGRDVLFFGGTALIWTPENDLKSAFALIDDEQGAVTNVHDVPAGHFGGTMRCGTTKTDDGEMPICGWADHGSLAVAMFPKRTEAESATLLREIRENAQSRD